MGFSDRPPSNYASTFMTHTQVVEYLEEYALTFELFPRVKLRSEVVEVKRKEDWASSGTWIVEYRREGCAFVVIL